MIRTYQDLKLYHTFEARYYYLKLSGIVGESTFGFDRYLNQTLYKSQRWLKTRDKVIIRDAACDLSVLDYEITDRIYVHHMNPLTKREIECDSDRIYDPAFLICTSYNTHLAIHFGNIELLPKLPIYRQKGDTCLW